MTPSTEIEMRRNKFGRRSFLAGAGAFAAAYKLASSEMSGLQTLSAAARAKGLLYGAEVGSYVSDDRPFAALVASQSSIVAPGWQLKWDTLQPSPERFDFSQADAYLRFAETNHLLARGHVLVWHEALPTWFPTVATAQNAKRLLESHIASVAGRYAGRLHSWDVVNEAVEVQDGRQDGLRLSPWLKLVGPDYIAIAFHAAHQADPHAFLVYNEDRLEIDTPQTQIKRQRVLALLRNLLRNSVPVHALGIQSHLPSAGLLGGPDFQRFLAQVSDMGLAILITEMDVFDQDIIGNIAERDRLVAKRYYDHLSCALKSPALKAILTWGLSNRYTWMARRSPRSDGLPVRPLPFDSNLKPTDVCTAIRTAFDEAPLRPAWGWQSRTSSNLP